MTKGVRLGQIGASVGIWRAASICFARPRPLRVIAPVASPSFSWTMPGWAPLPSAAGAKPWRNRCQYRRAIPEPGAVDVFAVERRDFADAQPLQG